MKCAGMLSTVRAGVTKSKGWLAASRTGLDRKDNVRSISRVRLAMLAGFGIEAGVGQAQPLDRLTANDVGFDDLVDVGFGDVPVPDGFWIDNDRRTVLALIEASGLIRPHFALQAALRELLLECLLQLSLSSWIAASPWIARRTLVPADENVFFELRHRTISISKTCTTKDTKSHEGKRSIPGFLREPSCP